MRNIFTALLLFISISLFSQDEKRLALVIGNANYDKGELKNPVNDARLIASTLDSLDFDVILKENLATKREMLSAIKEFGSKRSEYDVAFVYYAGHGIQVDNENFLLPTKEVFEEEFDVMDYGVSVQNIMRYLRAQTDEVNILILDACRDNPFESNWNKTRSLKGGGLAKIAPPTGSLIAFSTDSGQTAPDGEKENSYYTLSLSKNMLLDNTSIDQVFRNVRSEVLQITNGIQRPVEATQLVGGSFILNKTFSIYESSVDEILTFSESKISNGEFVQGLEILNSAADYFNTVKKYREEVILRSKLINQYSFVELSEGLPKHASLHLRNLPFRFGAYSTPDDSIEMFKEHFNSDIFDMYLENLFNLLTNKNKDFSRLVNKEYMYSIYIAMQIGLEVVNNNHFSINEYVNIPDIEIDGIDFESNGLAYFWRAKKLHLEFRTKPFSEKNYLIKNSADLNEILSKEYLSLIDKFNSDILIKNTDSNELLYQYTFNQYGNPETEIKRVIIDITSYDNTKNSHSGLYNSLYEEANKVIKKGFSYEDNIDLGHMTWFYNALLTQISRDFFYNNISAEEKDNLIVLFEKIKDYWASVKDEIETISYNDKEAIKKYNNFVERNRFFPYSRGTIKDNMIKKNSLYDFRESKSYILNVLNNRLAQSSLFLSYLELYENDTFQELFENKSLLEDWPFFSHELLWSFYLSYLENSSIMSSAGKDFKEKMYEYENAFKMNYINSSYVFKYLSFIKSFYSNKDLLFDYEFLTSLDLIERLIDSEKGKEEDILYLKYASLHIRLLVSSNSNICFDPVKLKKELISLKEKNNGDQNFLMAIYLDELDSFFEKNSLFYINSRNHFSESELKSLFKN